jgi:hypothetical protein
MTQARTTKTRVSPNNISKMTSAQVEGGAYMSQSLYGNTQKLKPPSGPSAQTIVNNDYRVQKSNLLVD